MARMTSTQRLNIAKAKHKSDMKKHVCKSKKR